MPHIKNLVEWALENMQDIVTSRQLFTNKEAG